MLFCWGAPPSMMTSYVLVHDGIGAEVSQMTVGGGTTSFSHKSRHALSARWSASTALPPGTAYVPHKTNFYYCFDMLCAGFSLFNNARNVLLQGSVMTEDASCLPAKETPGQHSLCLPVF